jgi:23S rRNA pseudouridine955/2504/2580 synthase|tara:strand:+ start:2067 stop:3059 length:993 start_codon:yes stop_codon:yes gene_type:complete
MIKRKQKMPGHIKQKVIYEVIDESSDGQKIDNFLIKFLKNVPKSHIYKILRSGEVRVNKKRVKTGFRLSLKDSVRIPPVDFTKKKVVNLNKASTDQVKLINDNTLFEDDFLLVLNKPSGLAVHGGSGLSFGVIELIRTSRPEHKFFELVHRIDKDTSGVLLIAKKRTALVGLHKQIREKKVHKKYQVVVNGVWKEKQKIVDLDLLKTNSDNGQKKVRVVESFSNNPLVKASRSVFFLKKVFGSYSLLDVKIITGRTHQIRTQLSHLGFPILGDDKYGDFPLNKSLRKIGLKRMLLHALELGFVHPITLEKLLIKAPLPTNISEFIAKNES